MTKIEKKEARPNEFEVSSYHYFVAKTRPTRVYDNGRCVQYTDNGDGTLTLAGKMNMKLPYEDVRDAVADQF